MIKRIIKKGFNTLGYKLQKKGAESYPKYQNPMTIQAALIRCKDRGLKIDTVIDVGASDGRWSKDCMKFFPEVNYLMIEAQEGHRSALENFKNDNPKVDFILAAAGRTEGNIYFNEADLFGGLASETPLEENCIEVPVISLDNEINKRNLKGPYLLKLDTHGFEIPILEGANAIMRNAELIIIETYNFKLTNDSLRYWEMCEYMEKLGFSPIENVDFLLRKQDKAFWQMDTFFIPSTNKAFSSTTFL